MHVLRSSSSRKLRANDLIYLNRKSTFVIFCHSSNVFITPSISTIQAYSDSEVLHTHSSFGVIEIRSATNPMAADSNSASLVEKYHVSIAEQCSATIRTLLTANIRATPTMVHARLRKTATLKQRRRSSKMTNGRSASFGEPIFAYCRLSPLSIPLL